MARKVHAEEIIFEFNPPVSQRTGEVDRKKENVMSLGTILIILLILALIGVLPTWGYSNAWGYGPGGIVGLLLVIIIILALLGRL